MKFKFLALSVMVIMSGCRNPIDEISKLISNESEITSRILHSYKFYKNGKIRSDKSTRYFFAGGIPFDTIESTEVYNYNKNGKTTSIFDTSDSSMQIMIYNPLDSLIARYHINESGDTTWLLLNKYEGNKLVKTTNRMLRAKLSMDIERVTKESFTTYDTNFWASESIYDGDKHIKSISKDSKGIITDERIHCQEDGFTKTEVYSFIGKEKYISETVYEYINNTIGLNYVTLNDKGDTTSYIKTILKDDMRIVTAYFREMETYDISYYNKQNKRLAEVSLNSMDNSKQVFVYKYDSNGNLVEEIDYRVRLK